MERVLEVSEPGRGTVRIALTGPLEVGRDCDGLLLADPLVSRRHLRLVLHGDAVVVSDLGSSNGTTVNGVPLEGSATLRDGDVVELGVTRMTLVPPQPTGVTGPVAEPAAVVASTTGALDELRTRAAVVCYRPRTAGHLAAPQVAAAATEARKQLRGLGSEPSGALPRICLVDPFPGPSGALVTEGAVVDPLAGEIWIPVTPESPPEPIGRWLAVLFGAALPAGAELAWLLEGYGLHAAGTEGVDVVLAQLELPPLSQAEGQLRGAMALSFVRFLVAADGEDRLRGLLAAAQPGAVDAAFQERYGAGLAKLESRWRDSLRAAPATLGTRDFLRLAVRHLRPHRLREAEMLVHTLLGLAFTLTFPFAFRVLIDDAIPSGQLDRVLTLLGLLAAAFAVSLLASLRRAFLAAYVSSAVTREIRSAMFERLQHLPARWFAKRDEGDVLSRFLTDVAQLEAGLSQSVREGSVQVATLLVAGGILVVLQPLLGVVVLLGAPLVALVYRRMAAGALSRSRAVQERLGGVLSIASESYAARDVVRAFSLEAHEASRFRAVCDRLFGAEVRLSLHSGLFGLSVNGIVTGLRLAVLGLGGWLILQGRFTLGGLVAFLSVMGEVLSPATSLTQIGQQLQASTGALLRINEVLEADVEMADPPGAPALGPLRSAIALDGVALAYEEGHRVLDGVSLEIPAGARVAFVGPSGAGKSSVLRLLTRTWDPDEGAVRFDGVDVRTGTLASLRGQLGVVHQDTFLFDTSVRENIRLGHPGATDAEVEAAARAAEVDGFIASLPNGYDTLVGERGGRLSGGQRQRLAIARALLRDPTVLVLDEATSALDPRTERRISDTLRRVGAGRTIVAVTHRLTSVADYDRIFVLVEGRLAEAGTHAELLARGGAYAALWAEQTGSVAPPSMDATSSLRRLPALRDAAEEDLAAVTALLRPTTLEAGTRLDERRGQAVLLEAGSAEVLAPGLSGRLQSVTTLAAGAWFGGAALLGEGHGTTLAALERCRLLLLDADALLALGRDRPGLAAVLDASAGPAPDGAVRGPSGGTHLSAATGSIPAALLTAVLRRAPGPDKPREHA
jgi:ABC-type multidrug transport system fused ATPase/permease subunit